MTWLKVDDEFPMHEKVTALAEGPCRGDAIALWTCAGCWSSRALKEGFVSNGVVRTFAFHPDAAAELVRVGLWEAVEGGYQFHDWADYQPSAGQVEARRKAGAERKARSRARLSGSLDSEQDPARVGMSRRDCGSVTAGVTGVPRTESRLCLADASRATGTGEGSDLQSEEVETYQESAREVSSVQPRPDLIGFRWFAALWGRSEMDVPPLRSFQHAHVWIGSRTSEERDLVAAAIQADPWCQANKHLTDPDHIVKRWARYLGGAPKTVVRADPRETDAADRVKALRQEYAKRIKAAREAGDEYTTEILCAERDSRVASLQARLAS